ncbi:MAG: DNA methylase N-4 [Bacteroidaceae bacterium]|nr:DNA methylase N-4 [Bacteroidaceae bacterium]MBQ5655888.1 DNA methylase N-4 [Bacteroidaceae bacterium]
MEYIDFLRSKVQVAPVSGFEVSAEMLSDCLKPHQKDAVIWALRGGRRALFESFGLGKTIQELEWCRLVAAHEGGQVLIVLPLGVRQEFTRDAEQLLYIAAPVYVRTMAEVKASDAQILMTNYERVRDGDIDPTYFKGVALDEASVLRSYGSKTFQTFMDLFRGVKYKLVATATPSPNRYKELIHYAGYLEVMDTGQALTRFFQRDSTKANNLTLYPHKEEEFWLWVSSWALFLGSPADLGYDATGYDLPPLEVRTHMIRSQIGDAVDKNGQVKLMRDAAVSLQDAAKEKRESVAARVAMAKSIVDSDPDAHFILWHDLEYERETILKEIPGTVDIFGSMDYDERERRVIDFAEGHCRLFATKKSLSGSGCNFQRHCHRAIFVGIDYEFNDFIQAIHRIYRFLQSEQVIIDVIYTEAEEQIWRILQEKWKNHDQLQANMRRIVMQYGLLGDRQAERMARSIGVNRVEIKGKNWTYTNNDCVDEVRRMPDNSVGLIHTSIPFSNHYEYTPSYNDFGHNEDTAKFFEQMDYLTPELLRILQPGRVAAIHVKDRVLFGNVTGYGMPSMEPFHAMCIQHYMKHGFIYFGMITVTTDVVRENNQTYRLGYTEQCKDGTKMGVGCPEYILLFRKLPTDHSKGYADDRVAKSKEEYTLSQWQLDAHAFWRSSGDRLLKPEELARLKMSDRMRRFREYSKSHVYDYDSHVAMSKQLEDRDAISKEFMTVPPASVHPDVWDDVNRMKTLNTTQSQRRKQLHVCPLQLDIVERIINRYSNPEDVVFDPFGGLATVPVTAVRMGRYGWGCELNTDYFTDGLAYLRGEEVGMEQVSLFDLMEQEVAI